MKAELLAMLKELRLALNQSRFENGYVLGVNETLTKIEEFIKAMPEEEAFDDEMSASPKALDTYRGTVKLEHIS